MRILDNCKFLSAFSPNFCGFFFTFFVFPRNQKKECLNEAKRSRINYKFFGQKKVGEKLEKYLHQGLK